MSAGGFVVALLGASVNLSAGAVGIALGVLGYFLGARRLAPRRVSSLALLVSSSWRLPAQASSTTTPVFLPVGTPRLAEVHRFDHARVCSGVPMTVSRQRPLGAWFTGEHGYAAPGVGQGRLGQRRSRAYPLPTCSDSTGLAPLRAPYLKRKEAPLAAVVATDPASVDADCDNGAALQCSARSRGCGGAADRRLAGVARRRRRARATVNSHRYYSR